MPGNTLLSLGDIEAYDVAAFNTNCENTITISDADYTAVITGGYLTTLADGDAGTELMVITTPSS